MSKMAGEIARDAFVDALGLTPHLHPAADASPKDMQAWAKVEAACTPPNQLTSAELGKLVEALERASGPKAAAVAVEWLPRVREACLSLVRWGADHG